MASLGHVAIGLAAGRAFGRKPLAPTMGAFAVLSLLPDADVIGLSHGVAYGSPFGHRGASHSLVVALVFALVIALASPGRRARTFSFIALVVGSHGLLDAMTDGGKGVALLWPFTASRFFFPWRPIPVAPIGAGILSPRGLHVMLFELVVFAPFWLYAFWPRPRKTRAR